MTSENTLFDDEFDLEFEPDLDTTDASDLFDDEDTLEPLEASLEPELRDLEPMTEADAALATEGGDKAIPAIHAVGFYETADVAELIEAVSKDRRMSHATVEFLEGGLTGAIAYLQENPTPNLLILESSTTSNHMIAQIDQLASLCEPGVEVMVIGAHNDISLYRQLMARGVSEYLVPPVSPVQLVRSIGELFSDPDAPFVGKSISVIGAKGGVGSSTVAHNLSWALSENAGVNTTLMDLDLSFGTTALDFNDDNQQTVLDALMSPDRADDAVIARLLSKTTDRLSLFTAPGSVNEVPDIDPEAYSKVINGVRRLMPFVVLDLPHVWNRWLYETVVASDEVVLVCQPDLASLRNGKNLIDKLVAERPNDTPPRVVLNMVGVPKRPEIPMKDFSSALGLEIDTIIAFDPQLFGTASNKGQMISEVDPVAEATVAIDTLAGGLSGREVSVAPKSFFDKLLGK